MISKYALIAILLMMAVGNSQFCSAFCSYSYMGNGAYQPNCNTDTKNDCTQCDATLFVMQPGTPNCIPHKYWNEYLYQLDCDQTYGAFSGAPPNQNFGSGTYAGQKTIIFDNTGKNQANGLYTNLPPHYAVRMRFFVYRSSNNLNYGVVYGFEGTEYNWNYNPSNFWYNSQGDIITSPAVTHYDTTLNMQFKLTQLPGIGFNIMFKEIMLWLSLCQPGCANCSSQYYCKNCTTVGGTPYYLNDVDHLCYTACPQTTYISKRNFDLFGANLASLGQPYCAPCYAACLQCFGINTNCSKCFTLGRNESFYFRGQCYYTCPYNYLPDFDNHTCMCPQFNHWQEPNPLAPSCNPCSVECLACTGPTNLVCTACVTGYFLVYGKTYCLVECPTGQFQNPFNNKCYPCDPTCSACTINSTYCIECFFQNKIMYLLNHACLSVCPSGYFMNNVTRTCDLCPPLTYSYLGTCVTNCPSAFIAFVYNGSCLPKSASNFTLPTQIQNIYILPDGKTIRFDVNFDTGLSQSSLKWLIKNSYFFVQIIMVDLYNPYSPPVSGRLLFGTTLTIVNIKVSANMVSFYTDIAPITSNSSFYINVTNYQLKDSDNISYANVTSVWYTINNPQLIREYFLYSVRMYFNLIILPFIVFILIGLNWQKKGTYQMLMEYLRYFQMLGLVVYELFPVNPSLFYFVIGLNYTNFDFLPNLYSMFAKTQMLKNVSSYLLVTPEMDFLRLMGAIILFMLVFGLFLFVLTCCFKMRADTVEWLFKLGIDLIQVKIIHSFWSSLIMVIVNKTSNNFPIYAAHGASYFFLGFIIAKRILIYRATKTVSLFFIWRLIGILLISLISFSNLLVIMLIFLVGAGFTLMILFFQQHYNGYFEVAVFTNFSYNEEDTHHISQEIAKNIQFGFCIKLRSLFLASMPSLAALCLAFIILLRDYIYIPIIIVSSLGLIFAVCLFTISVTIKKYLQSRKKYLTCLKVEQLQLEYAKLQRNDTVAEQQAKSAHSQVPYKKQEQISSDGDNDPVHNKFKIREDSTPKHPRDYINPLMKLVE